MEAPALIPCDGSLCASESTPRWLSPNSFLCNLPQCEEGGNGHSVATPEMDCVECETAALDHLYNKACSVTCCDAVAEVPDCNLCTTSHDEWKDLAVFDFASQHSAWDFQSHNEPWQTDPTQSAASSSATPSSSSNRDFSPPSIPQASTSTAISYPHICRWANCLNGFNTPGELANHVHVAHLSVPPAQLYPTTVLENPQPCLWDGCEILLPTKTDLNPDLHQHLHTDHLLPFLSTQTFGCPPPAIHFPQPQYLQTIEDISIPPQHYEHPLQPSLPMTNHFQLRGVHPCQWSGCTQIFGTAADLTAHLGDVHVGKGKSEYYCGWAGCARAGEGRKFTQRQKIMRHVQMHTGDRPYVCAECHKSFSEQTTLAQHMRTHTNERPHLCPEPGCGKSFALASALTIHIRTHTGDKPFKCTHEGCSAAFAESSNLRKHIRTHTGERKFECNLDGCKAKFGRSDQLARHMKMHERKGEL